jgi:hypothetical protein
MGYAIMQIKDATGTYVDWDGKLVALPDGTLGAVVVKKVLEEKVQRATGNDVVIGTNNSAVIATLNVPVGKVYKIWGYALSPDSTMIDLFTAKVGAVVQTTVYTRTYAGGVLEDYILVDNSAGGGAVAVTLIAHNSDTVQQHKASGYILAEDVTDSQAS